MFVANTFLSLAGKIAIDPVCANSYHYLFSLLVVYFLSKIVKALTDNASYTEKVIDMWEQV